MKKQVCIRLSENCIAMIEKQKGENFSQKLENMICFCNREMPRIEKDIEAAKKRLEYLKSDISDAVQTYNRIQMIDRCLFTVQEMLDDLIGEI